jgi:hypothetical protein
MCRLAKASIIGLPVLTDASSHPSTLKSSARGGAKKEGVKRPIYVILG